MKLWTRQTSLASVFICIAVVLNAPTMALAQPAVVCERDGNYEPASDAYRDVELQQFGIAISIPENYRAMGRQDGSVLLLHPNDFEWLQCLSRGGIGGGGYYFEAIEFIEPDPSMMNLREQAMWAVGYERNRDGSRSPSASRVVPYQQNGLQGYVVTPDTGTSAVFLGTTNNSEQLLRVVAGCDCEVNVEDLLDLLRRIRLL